MTFSSPVEEITVSSDTTSLSISPLPESPQASTSNPVTSTVLNLTTNRTLVLANLNLAIGKAKKTPLDQNSMQMKLENYLNSLNLVDLTNIKKHCGVVLPKGHHLNKRNLNSSISNCLLQEVVEFKHGSIEFAAAIDIGLDNLATCIVHVATGRVVHWNSQPLTSEGTESYSSSNFSSAVEQYLKETFDPIAPREKFRVAYERMFNVSGSKSSVLFRKMVAIESQIASSFGRNAIECSPKTVMFMLDLDADYKKLSNYQKRKTKKQATIKTVKQAIEDEVFQVSNEMRFGFEAAEKQDDMADSFLLLYAVLLFTFNRLHIVCSMDQ
jgi:hypothetical protein